MSPINVFCQIALLHGYRLCCLLLLSCYFPTVVLRNVLKIVFVKGLFTITVVPKRPYFFTYIYSHEINTYLHTLIKTQNIHTNLQNYTQLHTSYTYLKYLSFNPSTNKMKLLFCVDLDVYFIFLNQLLSLLSSNIRKHNDYLHLLNSFPFDNG